MNNLYIPKIRTTIVCCAIVLFAIGLTTRKAYSCSIQGDGGIFSTTFTETNLINSFGLPTFVDVYETETFDFSQVTSNCDGIKSIGIETTYDFKPVAVAINAGYVVVVGALLFVFLKKRKGNLK